jgi:hypothetical protein
MAAAVENRAGAQKPSERFVRAAGSARQICAAAGGGLHIRCELLPAPRQQLT